MAESQLENIHDLSDEVQVYLDPSEEVFFGPVTERERQVRQHLPRRTLHPCEIVEISKRGMDFHQWENFKSQQLERNERNAEAIDEVFGLDDDDSGQREEDDQQHEKKNHQQEGEGLKERPSIDTTIESFNSCTSAQEESEEHLASIEMDSSSEGDSQGGDVSGVASLNDTWSIQERMLEMAERLERGEDVPELGIRRHPSGAVEYVSRSSNKLPQHCEMEITNLVNTIETSATNYLDDGDDKENVIGTTASSAEIYDGDGIPEIVSYLPRDSADSVREKPDADVKQSMTGQTFPSLENLTKEMDDLILTKRTISETPMKDPSGIFNLPTPIRKAPPSATRVVPETPNKSPIKTPSGSAKKKPLCTPLRQLASAEKKPVCSPKTLIGSASKPARPTSAVKNKAVHATASPVGMYIRSLPEPMLIENVRSSGKKKEVQTNPAAIKPPRMAIKNKEGRWSLMRTPTQDSTAVPQTDIKPVLPVVLHEAAASVISEDHSSPASMPGVGGKIGKLLERGVTPTVLKHQGRIQLSKDSAKTSKIINSPSTRSDKRPESEGLLEVSVLEKMPSGKSSIPIRQKPAYPCRKN